MNARFVAVLLALIALVSHCKADSDSFCRLLDDKLPDYVTPVHYDLFINPDFITLTYDGELTIGVKIKDQPKEAHSRSIKDIFLCRHGCDDERQPSNVIAVHVDQSVEIRSIDYQGSRGGKNKILSQCRDQERQMLAVQFAHNLSPDSEAKLTIKFHADIRQDMRGIYRSFRQDEPEKFVIATQLQGSDIRYAFPSFDEPRFKASVGLRLATRESDIAIATSEVQSIKSAMVTDFEEETARKQVHKFDETAKIHVNLFAFAIGDFEYKSDIAAGSGVIVSLYAIRGYHYGYEFALQLARRALRWMEKYTGHSYPMKKFDILALPDHNKGNTENFGLATIRDTIIQIDEETREDAKITAAVNIVHVVAHQWFANMVTMSDWGDLWVTEGLAAHLAYEMVREFYTEFRLDPLVRIGLLSTHLQKSQRHRRVL